MANLIANTCVDGKQVQAACGQKAACTPPADDGGRISGHNADKPFFRSIQTN